VEALAVKAWLEINRSDGSIDRRELVPHDNYAEADGACPGCGATPFQVAGHQGAQRLTDNRTLRAGGRCLSCGDAVGYLYAQPDTIFGLEEDARVRERARVYT
jgi:hypothetical protein